MSSPYSRWAAIIRPSAYERVVTLDRRITNDDADVVFLPESLNEFLWSHGVWSVLNSRHGAHIQLGEEDDLDADQARALAGLISDLAADVTPPDAVGARAAAAFLEHLAASGEGVVVAQ
jgi:hypothetical protein